MPRNDNAIGEALEIARRQRGLTPEDVVLLVIAHPDLGPRYRFHPDTLRNVERGRVGTPSVRTQFALSTVYDIPFQVMWPPVQRRRRELKAA